MTLGRSSSSAVLACAMASKASPGSDSPRSRLGGRRVAPADEAVVEEDAEHARGRRRVRHLLRLHNLRDDPLRARARLAVEVRLQSAHGAARRRRQLRRGARREGGHEEEEEGQAHDGWYLVLVHRCAYG